MDAVGFRFNLWETFRMRVRLLAGLHSLMRSFFKLRGFEWEVRRAGDLHLGYWKMTLRKRDSRSAYPRRFVLIPGFGDTSLSWYPVTVLLNPWLKAHYDELILFDFPAFSGFLSRERAFPSMEALLSSTFDALDALKPQAILGHSLGGWISSHYAIECGTGRRPSANSLSYKGPEILMLVNPSGIFPDEKFKIEWGRLFKTHLKEKGFAALRPHLFRKEPFWFRFILDEFHHFVSRKDILQFIDSVRDDHHVGDSVHQIQCKVWLIWGEQDSLVPPICASAWLRSFNQGAEIQDGRVQAVLLPGSGHSPHLEQPVVTAAVIGRILEHKSPYRWGRRWWKLLTHTSSSSGS